MCILKIFWLWTFIIFGLLLKCSCSFLFHYYPSIIRSSSSSFSDSKMMMMCDKYMFMEKNISSLLTMEQKTVKNDNLWINPNTGMIRWSELNGPSKDDDDGIPDRISMGTLIASADQCDAFLFTSSSSSCHRFHDHVLSIKLQPFVSMVNSAKKETQEEQVLISTLLALNQLELQLCEKGNFTPGKSPLLKDLLKHHDLPTMFQHTLCTLLLPQNGLNLRNLLWHGFVCTLPRRWLSLCILLTHNLERQQRQQQKTIQSGKMNATNEMISCFDTSMENNLPFLPLILNHGKELYNSMIMQQQQQQQQQQQETIDNSIVERLSQIFPVTHRSIFEVACQHYMKEYPIIFSSIVSVLLEHTLRIHYSLDSDNQHHLIARENEYYVTLDGHGQRHKHELLLYPSETNSLISTLGAPLTALFTDFFASPFNHNNIRSTMAHGAYNSHLQTELQQFMLHQCYEENKTTTALTKTDLTKFTYILLAICNFMSWKLFPTTTTTSMAVPSSLFSSKNQKSILDNYKPMYSFTAVTLQNLHRALNQLEQLQLCIHMCHQSSSTSTSSLNGPSSQFPSKVTIEQIKQKVQTVFVNEKFMFHEEDNKNQPLELHHLIQHQKSNQCLESCSAARLLLEEIAQGISNYIHEIRLKESVVSSSSRKQKQYQRLLSMVPISFEFYVFATYIAILYIQSAFHEQEHITMDNHGHMPINRKDLLRTVERSRMCISTYSTFLHTNIDRATKAMDQYQKGKIIKSIFSHLQEENES